MTEVMAALIWRGKRFLACRRPANKARALLWEFVGGKVEPGETRAQALIRECREELGITVAPKDVFMEVTHTYPDMQVHMTLMNAEIAQGEPQRLEHSELRWVTPGELDGMEFCPADEAILQRLQAEHPEPKEAFDPDCVGKVIREMQGPCACGRVHATTVRDIRIGKGLVHRVGEILQENGFAPRLLLVADRNTLAAAAGVQESLGGFQVETMLYPDLRVATMEEVEAVERRIAGQDMSVLSVGTGSLNDICRLACARQDKLLALFATAPSMDGFASYSAPIVQNGFKASWPAKSPEVILGDTEILARAPAALKSAGFGDMIAKYVALVDWQISALLTGEELCPRVAELTRRAVDDLTAMADRVTRNDEETAGQIFASLLLTGVGMSFMQNSRPASGSEHVVAHCLECKQLPEGIVPNLHGEDVGVCTLEMLTLYERLAALETIHARPDATDWQAVEAFYGPLWPEVDRLNRPAPVTDGIAPEQLQALWPQIRAIIRSVPGADACRLAMERAGCKCTCAQIGKPRELLDDCIRFSPYMRRRITLLRLLPMIEEAETR